MTPLRIFFNIFRKSLLRGLFSGCLVIAIIIIIYSHYYVMPGFSDLFVKDLETEALRAGRYLAATILTAQKNDLKNFQSDPAGEYSRSPVASIYKEMFSREVINKIKKSQYYLQIEKLKVFDNFGEIIFSTDKKDIGDINRKPYFLNKVAKGEIFSKIVRKGAKSAEDQTYQRDVAEIYVPFMNKSKFIGAFEIYYDVSESRQALTKLVSHSLTLIYAFTAFFISFIVMLLYRGSKQMIRQQEADDQLKEAKSQLEAKVLAQTDEIKVTQAISVEALSILAEYHDEDTGSHLNRIQAYVEMLTVWVKENSIYSQYLSRKPNYIEEVKLACLLHDVGKTAIPLEILNKPGKLTDEEFETMKNHTTIAGEALGRANEDFRQKFNADSYLALARDIALYHHEKWNGKGYPKGLSGKAIPLSARIVAVVDVYDALRNKRPYKEPWTHQDAYQEILKCKSEQFDPIIIAAFTSVAEKFKELSEKYNERRMNEHQQQAYSLPKTDMIGALRKAGLPE